MRLKNDEFDYIIGPLILNLSKPLEIRFVLLLLLLLLLPVTNLQNRTGSDLFSPYNRSRRLPRRLKGAAMWPKATNGGRRPPAREASVPAPQGPRRRAAKRLELLVLINFN